MAASLNQLLLTHRDPQWPTRLAAIHSAVRQATCFDPGSDEDRALNDILARVQTEGDAALVAFSQRFDQVTLAPKEFRIPLATLAQAHANLDAALLTTLKKAIANVRDYHTAIFVGDKINHDGVRYTPIERVGI